MRTDEIKTAIRVLKEFEKKLHGKQVDLQRRMRGTAKKLGELQQEMKMLRVRRDF